ncbi:hypothetical protein HMPREF1870_02857 [Bacteroidales bacterium KA00344]|nr:hypothetical protein HMPREF1870_02857 [Bacteroidales bacterium KA00344]
MESLKLNLLIHLFTSFRYFIIFFAYFQPFTNCMVGSCYSFSW